MSVVTTLLVTSRTLMIIAAAISSFFVLRIRPPRCLCVSPGSPSMSGITATPVSKPERPSARRGKRSIATRIIDAGFPYSAVAAPDHAEKVEGRSQR
jgi:hypothetical protein